MRLFVWSFLILLISCVPNSTANSIPPNAWISFQSGLPAHATALALAVDPQDPQRIFAGTYDAHGAYISTDQARTWRTFNQGLERAPVLVLRFAGDALFAGTSSGLYRLRQAQWMRVDAIPAVAIYAITRDTTGALGVGTDGHGIFSSADEGKTWVHIGGLDDEIVLSLAVLNSQTLLAGTSGHGAFVTRDGGKTWRGFDAFNGEYVSFIAFDPRDARNIYLRTRGGLYRSFDAGATWQLLQGGIQTEIVHTLLFDAFSNRIYAATGGGGVFVSEDGLMWQSRTVGLPQGVAALALAQIDARTFVVGTQNGIYLTHDAGRAWQAANEGLGAPQLFALALNSQTGVLFAATEDGLYRAYPNGSFERIGNEAMRVPILSLAIAPSNPQVICAGAYRRGIFSSRDGGETWNAVSDIFRGRLSPTGLAIDPQDEQNIFARVLFERIYKSGDGGDTWHAVWTGMPDDAEVETMSIAPSDPTQMFAGTNDGVYSSEDAGGAWMWRGLSARTVLALWIDPHHSRRVFAGATDGLYRSEDAGENWRLEALEPMTVTALTQAANGAFLAGTKYNGVWVSRDNAKTWARMGSELSETSVIALVVDDARGMIYAATTGGLFKIKL